MAGAPPRASDPTLVLASASPRRRRLLSAAGVPFVVEPADIEERPHVDEQPGALVERLAREKAETVAARYPADRTCFVLGSDTIVVIDGEILGKPRDPDHAVELLRRLTGRRHTVFTGIALAPPPSGAIQSQHVTSRVRMRDADDDELERYVASGEPLDKAGAYAFQGEGRRFVEAVEGSESNVIGLPVEETLALLRRAGFRWERH